MPAIVERQGFTEKDRSYLPFRVAEGEDVPGFVAIGESILVRQTSSTHGQDGYISTDAAEIAAQRQRMKDKLEDNVGSFSYCDFYPAQGAETLIITYGVTARAARQAVAGQKGGAALLVLKTLWPVPEELIMEKAMPFQDIVVLEMNLGQYFLEIERVLRKKVRFLGKMDGTLITPAQIREVVAHV